MSAPGNEQTIAAAPTEQATEDRDPSERELVDALIAVFSVREPRTLRAFGVVLRFVASAARRQHERTGGAV